MPTPSKPSGFRVGDIVACDDQRETGVITHVSGQAAIYRVIDTDDGTIEPGASGAAQTDSLRVLHRPGDADDRLFNDRDADGERLLDRLEPEQIILLNKALDALDVRQNLSSFEVSSSWDKDNQQGEVLLDVARDLWTAALWGQRRDGGDDDDEQPEGEEAEKAQVTA